MWKEKNAAAANEKTLDFINNFLNGELTANNLPALTLSYEKILNKR